MKKALKLKLFVLCKTRVRKSSPDIFNFYIVLTGPDLVTDKAGLTNASRISKHIITNKMNKKQGPPENMGFNGKTVLGFPTNKKQYTFLASSKQPHETYGPQLQQMMMDFETRKKET